MSFPLGVMFDMDKVVEPADVLPPMGGNRKRRGVEPARRRRLIQVELTDDMWPMGLSAASCESKLTLVTTAELLARSDALKPSWIVSCCFFPSTLPEKPATVTEQEQQLGYLGCVKPEAPETCWCKNPRSSRGPFAYISSYIYTWA